MPAIPFSAHPTLPGTAGTRCWAWMEEILPEDFTVFALPELSEAQRKKPRTINMVEFQNKELKKGTRIIKVFSNKESLLRVASAMLIELDEKWQADGKAYIGI